MKNAYDVLVQKEADLARLRREVDSLKMVASLLDDDSFDNSKEDALPPRGKDRLEPKLNLDALTNDRLFSSIGLSGSRLWKVFRRAG
jgi:hypothetical protein